MTVPPTPPNRARTKSAPPAAKTGSQVRRRRLLIQIGVLGVVALAGLYLLTRSGGGSGGAHPSFAVGTPGVGQPAPPIQLPAAAGGTFDLAAQHGKTVLLYFQEGVGCEPCWTQIRDLQPRMADLHALGIDEMVTVAGNRLDQLRQKASDENITIPVLADPDLTLGSTYRANHYGMMGTGAYGHTFIVVGADGVIRWRGDYGGAPNYTMYVRPDALFADIRTGLATNK
ncbi:MAG: peroxiredoxin family protein [Acidimicrobiales bacterium]